MGVCNEAYRRGVYLGTLQLFDVNEIVLGYPGLAGVG